MSFPRYTEYKSSGVEWLGEVPIHWSTAPLLRVARERSESNAGMVENNLLSLSYGNIVKKDITANDGLLPESFETYQIVHPGDIVLRLTDLQNDKRSLRSALVGEKGIITSAYLCLAPTKISPAHLAYLIRAYDVSKVFYSMGGGLRQSMNFADLKRLPVAVPPLAEQFAIAGFLDHETAKIDALVAEQVKLIALLKEKRQAVISHAVTKGLDSHVPMKPSGIKWLGDVPAHWSVKQLRYLAAVETGSKDTVNAVDEGDYPFFVRSDTVERIDSFTYDCEAVLTAGDGAGVGKVFHHFSGKFDAHQRVYVLHSFKGVSGRFLYFYLRELFARVALEGGAKSTVDSLRRPMFQSFAVATPPMEEQGQLVKWIDGFEGHSSALIQEAELGVSLLKERRSALITAAVTGQIDVRSAGEG